MRISLCMALLLCAMFLSAQDARTNNSFVQNGGNYLASYEGKLSSISKILNTEDVLLIHKAKQGLKDMYFDMSTVVIDDSDLGGMLAPTQDNFNTWSAVLNQAVQNNKPQQELYVLRSVLINIKKKI